MLTVLKALATIVQQYEFAFYVETIGLKIWTLRNQVPQFPPIGTPCDLLIILYVFVYKCCVRYAIRLYLQQSYGMLMRSFLQRSVLQHMGIQVTGTPGCPPLAGCSVSLYHPSTICLYFWFRCSSRSLLYLNTLNVWFLLGS